MISHVPLCRLVNINQTKHIIPSKAIIHLIITPISGTLKCFVLLPLVPKNSIWCDFQRGSVHVEIWKHPSFCVWNRTSLWCTLAAISMASNCWNKLPVKAAAVVRSHTMWPIFIYQLTYSHGMMEICHNDIIWHVSDFSQYAFQIGAIVYTTIKAFRYNICGRWTLIVDCLISVMSVCFVTNNVSLFRPFFLPRFLVFREDSWLWKTSWG